MEQNTEIIIKLNNIEKELQELKQVILNLKDTTKRMDDHISFVESTYDTLKKPLDFVKQKVNYLTSN